jgi:dTDP-4-amino-4,6-dideoxygalactose transaminase
VDYDKAFAGLPLRSPVVGSDRDHTYYKYVVLSDRRAELSAHLADRGIGTRQFHPLLVNQRRVLDMIPHRFHPVPVAGRVGPRHLCLPIYAELTDEEVEHVIESVLDFHG